MTVAWYGTGMAVVSLWYWCDVGVTTALVWLAWYGIGVIVVSL